MATQSVTQAGATTQVAPFLERVLVWTRAHRQATSWVITLLVVGAVLFVWNVSSTRRSEAIAGRLLQGQSQQAVEVLRDFAPSAGAAFRAQAYGLLGAAYENLGKPREAAAAYQTGAERARMGFLKAQMLSDAGRAWVAAGDTS